MSELLHRELATTMVVRAVGDPEERIIEGTIVPFGQVVEVRDTPDGKVYRETIAAGATASIDPAKVTLEAMNRAASATYNTHDGAVLIGRGISVAHSDAGTSMALRVARTAAGDEILELAREGVLTDLSVAFRPVAQRLRPDGVVERTAIDVRRVAVVERGAYPAAQITAVRADPDGEPEPEPIPEPVPEPVPEPEPTPEPARQAPQKSGPTPRRSKHVDYTTPENREARIGELKEAIVRQGAAFTGVLPADEQVRYDADNAELEDLLRDKAAYESRMARNAELETHEQNREDPVPARSFPVPQIRGPIRDPYSFDETTFRNTEQKNQAWRDDAMRITDALRSLPHPKADVEASRDRIATILDYHDSPDRDFARRVKATAAPIYERAFAKWLTGQRLSPEEERGTALAVGVDGTGGFTVPIVLDPTVIAVGIHTGAINPYRRSCRVVPLVGTDTWNALTAAVVTATRTTEAAPAIEQGPAFLQPQYIVTRVQAQVTYSFEMAQDRTDIASEMATLISEAKDNEEENSFAIGTGPTATPIGVLAAYGTSGAYTQMDTIGSTVLAAADAVAVEAALPVRHRMNAQWFMNRKTIRSFQALETTGGQLFGGNGGYPAVGSNVVNATDGNTGLRLLGYPVNESPSAPVATTSHIIAASLINPDSFVIVERIGMTLRLIPDIINSSALATGQSALYAIWRNTAKPLNVDAGRMLDYKT